ncbi:MAG: agmatine deiminase family protein, partial [Saprospiraceae bacterium]
AIMTGEGMAFMDFDDKANSGMDEHLPTNLANLWGLPAYEIPWIFDGGNLLVDGYRTLFCTNGLYLNNPAWPKAALHQDLKQYMGIEQIVTLKPQHNDYWKHIDMQIKLLDDTTFVVSSVTPGYSPNYDSLEANYALLAALTAPNGKPYRIARLPHADNWKTYANALILNNRVIVPTYDHPLDSLALAIYADLMPQHTVRGVNCNKIIGWEGALHCITMQLFDDEQVVSLKKQYAYAPNLRLSPNPVPRDGAFVLYADEALHGPALLTLYAADGRTLRVWDARLEERQAMRLPNGLPSGAYLLRIQTEGAAYALRLIVR